MKRFDPRIPALLLLSCCTAFAAGAAEADKRSDANADCRQETKRVAVWPHGSPKAPMMARFEQRQVTVCDAKASPQLAKGK